MNGLIVDPFRNFRNGKRWIAHQLQHIGKAVMIPVILDGIPRHTFEMMGQIKNMFDRMTNSNDQRSNLLMSLKPFMRTERQRSIDRVTKLMNIARFSGLFRK